MHHVIDLPNNVTEAARQVAEIVAADRTEIVSSLKPGDSLLPGAVLTNQGNTAKLSNQLDGNIVLYALGASQKATWSAGTLNKSCAPQRCGNTLELTTEGALRVMAPSGNVVWAPPGVVRGSEAMKATELILQTDCNLVLKNELQVLWASGTKCIGQLTHSTSRTQSPLFYVLRNILKSAGWMVDVADAITKAVPKLTFVDPYSLGLLVKCHTGAIDCTH
eukprot:COSAG01_NODE_594_length_15086_cov_39.948805_13_plen_220_part_00